ncbi:DUF108 domain-containing protein [Rhodococcus sp. 105337]|nr:DUF108 domain-containing protein [Rhodococcus sp. 105337]
MIRTMMPVRPGQAPGTNTGRMKVAVMGYGTIGRIVAQRLAEGAVAGAELVAVTSRSPVVDAPALVMDLDDALQSAEVVVECAGRDALRANAERILDSGCDLIVSSVGALYDAELASMLERPHPGTLVCTNGAIGGLDVLAAAADAAPFDSVLVRSTKSPGAMIQPWMGDAEVARIVHTDGPVLVFSGTPADAARLFPASLNVAAAVAFAVGGRRAGTNVTVELYADPAATLTRHEVEAAGPVGRYSIRIENLPSEGNPRTSAVVPYSILRTLAARTRRPNLIG